MDFISITNNHFEGGTIASPYPTIELHNIKHLIFTNNAILNKTNNEYDFILDTTEKAVVSSNIFADTAYIDAGTNANINGNFGTVTYK